MRIETDSRPPEAGSPLLEKAKNTKDRRRRRDNGMSLVWSPTDLPRQSTYAAIKTICDRVTALVLLVLTSPIIVAAALLVKLTSAGPAFYTQTRVGRRGRLFNIYKIRTMIDNCESLTGPRWSIPGDPRVTRLGRILRRTHLDELPQLVNVLCGEMSLIGPRPERPELIPELDDAIPGYRARLSIRPGVTGLAQVNLPADTDLISVRRKLAYDLYYIQRLGAWLDFRIMLATILYSVGVPFRFSRKLLRLPQGEGAEWAIQSHQADSSREEHHLRNVA